MIPKNKKYSSLKEDLMSGNIFTYMDIPQKLFTLGATSLTRMPFGGKGVYAKPSDVIKNDWGMSGIGVDKVGDYLVDPLNLISSPAGTATKALLRKGANGGIKAAKKVRKINKRYNTGSVIGGSLEATNDAIDEVNDMRERYEKNKGKIKIPAHAFGIDQLNMISQAGQLVGGAIEGLSPSREQRFGMLPEMTDGQIVGGTMKDAASGLATGASLGSIIPGLGTVVGGAAGAVIGGIGSLIGADKRRDDIRKANNRIRTQRQTDAGLDVQAQLESEYYDDNGRAYTFANGGIMPLDLAYVDNAEILRDISGNLAQVPNTKNGVDEHLINASQLDSVLSDKLKVPGTKHTFAQAGEKVMRTYKPSKGNDKFAENTNKLNKISANNAYDNLLAEQEEVKIKKGIVPKMKNIPTYAYGDDILRLPSIWNTPMDAGFGRTFQTPEYNFLNDRTPAGRLPWFPRSINGSIAATQTSIPNAATTTDTSTKPISSAPASQKLSAPMSTLVGSKVVSITDTLATPKYKALATSKPVLPEGKYVDTSAADRAKLGTNPDSVDSGFNFGSLAALVPTMYNWIQGMQSPEQEALITNPYSGQIRRSMANRRFNIDPILEANRTSRAIANYNANRVNPNTGMNLALRTQMAADEYRANADLYAQKQNVDNQYIADYANTLNNLGGQYVQQRQYQEDVNARNRAAARNYTGSAASQFGNWSQVQQQMNNQQNRDDMVWPMLSNWLSQYLPSDQMATINKNYQRGRYNG